MSLLLDLLLAALLVALALRCAGAFSEMSAVAAFMALGLVAALAWVRLGSVDVALTEAAIGSGATGFLLVSALARLRSLRRPALSGRDGPSASLRAVAALGCGVVTLGLGAVLTSLPEPAPSLAPAAVAAMAPMGLGNAVTAVLLGYRSLDTLLETVVLLLAMVGVWTLAPLSDWGAPGRLRAPDPPSPLVFLARVLPPVGILAGIYLFWEGANAPGGAFQGGTVLAAMAVLVMLAGLVPAPRMDDIRLRWALLAGAALFMAIGLAAAPLTGHVLAWPEGFAKPLILAVEAGLTFSIAVSLAMLVAGQSQGRGR